MRWGRRVVERIGTVERIVDNHSPRAKACFAYTLLLWFIVFPKPEQSSIIDNYVTKTKSKSRTKRDPITCMSSDF
jgi:hypothetical protein